MALDFALDGVKVLGCHQVHAGAYSARLLAEMGAEVIKIERPGRGEWIRTGTARDSLPYKGESYYIANMAVNQKCITLNLAHQKGKEIFLRLVRWADVFIENLAPGTMKRLGLDFEAQKKVNPKIIYASIKGYGHDTPYKDLRGVDYLAQGRSGLMDMTGFPGTPPTLCGAPIVDHHAGVLLAFSIMCALYYRNRTGKGQSIGIALTDAAIDEVFEQNMEYLVTGLVPRKRANSQFGASETAVYKAKDGYIISYIDNWPAICRAIGREELINDPRFNTLEKRGYWGPAFSMMEEVQYTIEDWTKTKTRDEAVEALRKEGIMCERIQSIPEVFEDPYTKARKHKIFVEVEHPTIGKITLQRSPLNLSETPSQIKSAGAPLGYHNEEVLGKLLGYKSEEIAALKKEGVI